MGYGVAPDSLTVDTEAPMTFARSQRAPHKIPKLLQLVDSLPRNPNGKVLKTALPEDHAERRCVIGADGR